MLLPRVIPCLLLHHSGFVKTVKFRNMKYLGDPINIVKIFNEKEVDELVLLDISATVEMREPPFGLLEQIVSEAFIPVAYGGGIQTVADVKRILGLGVEKVVLNSSAVANPALVRSAAEFAGSQSIVISIDVKKRFWGGYEVMSHGGRKATGKEPVEFAARMENSGAGEILLCSIDRDGTMEGYDLDLINQVTRAVNIPVVACGGARNTEDLALAVNRSGASAASAGSMFVFQGPHRAVLISYPSRFELETLFSTPVAGSRLG